MEAEISFTLTHIERLNFSMENKSFTKVLSLLPLFISADPKEILAGKKFSNKSFLSDEACEINRMLEVKKFWLFARTGWSKEEVL